MTTTSPRSPSCCAARRAEGREGGGSNLHPVATIGALPLVPAQAYAAVYMKEVLQPGMRSPVHRHPGVEAWYTVEGSMGLETSEGTLTGPGPRRSVVLILQGSAQARSSLAHDWTPKGQCRLSPS